MEIEEHKEVIGGLDEESETEVDTKSKQLYDEYIKTIPELENKFTLKPNEFDYELEWYNSDPLYFEEKLKNKIVLIDFWTSWCCDWLHLLPVLEKLEKKFEGKHGVAFIGVHSGKFEAESNSFHLKKNIIKYDIKHPVINDSSMQVWSEYKWYYWPTVFVISPYRKILKRYDEIVDPKDLEIFLEAAYDYYYDSLNKEPLPIHLERHKEYKDNTKDLGIR